MYATFFQRDPGQIPHNYAQSPGRGAFLRLLLFTASGSQHNSGTKDIAFSTTLMNHNPHVLGSQQPVEYRQENIEVSFAGPSMGATNDGALHASGSHLPVVDFRPGGTSIPTNYVGQETQAANPWQYPQVEQVVGSSNEQGTLLIKMAVQNPNVHCDVLRIGGRQK